MKQIDNPGFQNQKFLKMNGEVIFSINKNIQDQLLKFYVAK